MVNAFGVKVIVRASAVAAVGIGDRFPSKRSFITALVRGIILACSLFGLGAWIPRQAPALTKPAAS